jgi:MAE_28990/MAE_18760-like HEPN
VETHAAQIKALVSRRNEIAHGKKMMIRSLQEYQPFEDTTFFTMHELAVCVVDSLEEGLFLNNPRIEADTPG